MGGEFDFRYAESQVPGRQFQFHEVPSRQLRVKSYGPGENLGFMHSLLSSVYCNLYRGGVKGEKSK